MENKPGKRKNFLSLIIGSAFISYGSYRLITYFNGAEYSTFRLVIAVGFIVLGAYDLYKFYSSIQNE